MKNFNLVLIIFFFLAGSRIIHFYHINQNLTNEVTFLCSDNCEFEGYIKKINYKSKSVIISAILKKSSVKVPNDLILKNISSSIFEKIKACYEIKNCKLAFKTKKTKIKKEFLRSTFFSSLNRVSFNIGENNNFIRKLNNYIYDLISEVGDKSQKANEFRSFLKALVLGIQDNNFSNIKQKFVFLGISHLIVISGLHLSLIYISVRIILKIILSLSFLITGLSFNNFVIIEFITLFIIFLYKLVLPDTIPIERAFIMLFSYSISKILPFKTNAFSVFVLSIFIIVFSYPPSLYMPSFYLSFISVFALISFHEIKIKDRGIIFISYFYKMLISSLLIFVFSFAINLFLFKTLSLSSPFLNLIFIPLTFFLIIVIILNFVFCGLIGFLPLEKLMGLFFRCIDYFYYKNSMFFIVDELRLHEVIIYLTGIFLISNAIIFKKDSFL